MEVCPKKAITLDRTNGRSYIDQDKCVKCGQCAKVCGYQAIIIQERPCARACGMDAIGSDENGKADIDYEKCVSCGQCLVNCPFGAISDKSQIFQLARALSEGEQIIAEIAPAFTGQFGDNINARNLKAALEELGFSRDQVYTTLELRMKCGVGKCGRCNIGTKYVCKDGPVFRCDELDEMPAEY